MVYFSLGESGKAFVSLIRVSKERISVLLSTWCPDTQRQSLWGLMQKSMVLLLLSSQ